MATDPFKSFFKFKAGLFIIFCLCLSDLALGQQNKKYQLPEGVTSDDYVPGVVIFKFDEGSQETGNKPIHAHLVKILKVKNIKKALPGLMPGNKGAKGNVRDLSLIYSVELSPGQDVLDVISKLLEIPGIEYAEPYYLAKPLFEITQTDPHQPSQYYLKNIKAFEAWSIEKGSPNIVVGVLDTGIDYDHPDLKQNHFINIADPLDKFDNDGDGFVDNYLGWDFANNDNDPMADFSPHGTQVAGVIAAGTNNGIGISGVGYYSKVMPVKVFRSQDDLFRGGYEAIAYAADKGCKVINLSWGSASVFSQYAQDIINYAVLEKDVVIVAAAGNSGKEEFFYPASYDNVLSVGASDANDLKASWATFNTKIDILAPGVSIYTTTNNNSYISRNGSSLSAPMVAGAAALLRARFPHLSAVQIMERIRVTSDNVSDLDGNKQFKGKIGSGRLNIFRALTEETLPSLKMAKFFYKNRFGSHAFYGDTISIEADFINYLNTGKDIRVTLASSSPYVTILDSVFHVGDIATLESANNSKNPFRIYLHSNLPPSHLLQFSLKIEGENYQDFQYFNFTSSPAYVTLSNEKLRFTASSNGNLGLHSDRFYEGAGIEYQNQRILEQMGLIISHDNNKVVNNIVTDFYYGVRDTDFESVQNIKFYNDSEAHIDARSSFKPASNTGFPGLNIEQKILGWNGDGSNEFLIIEYRFTNTSGSDLENIRTGLYANWQLNNPIYNEAAYDGQHKLGYVLDKQSKNLFAGLSLLSDYSTLYFAIDQESHNGNPATFGQEFTRDNKIQVLNNGIANNSAGSSGEGNDVSHVIGGHIGLIKTGQSIKIAYAIVAGNNLLTLQNAASQAQRAYQNYAENPPVLSVVNICPFGNAHILPATHQNNFYEDSRLQNLLFSGKSFELKNISENKTIYVTNTDKGFESDVKQVSINVNFPHALFAMSHDTLIVEKGEHSVISFYDRSEGAAKWNWNFNNGYKSTVKNPKIKFVDEGVYKIELETENATGCRIAYSKNLVVLHRAEKPVVSNIIRICADEMVKIEAGNTRNIRVYRDSSLKLAVFEGEVFETKNIIEATTFYITNTSGTIESLPVKVDVFPNKVNADFTFNPIKGTEGSKSLKLNSFSKNGVAQEWYIEGKYFSNDANPILDNISWGESLSIKLVSWNDNLCSSSVVKIIEVKESPLPIISNAEICKGENVVIEPKGGASFNFYGDEKLTLLLHSGPHYQLNNMQSSSTMYVTNTDYLFESKAAPVVISVNSIKAEFISSSDTVYLSKGAPVSFYGLSPDAVSWKWDFDGHLQFVQNPVYRYSKAGIHKVKLSVENAHGCVDNIEKEVVVIDDYSADTYSSNHLALFPNPSTGVLTVSLAEFTEPEYHLTIKNQVGKTIYEVNEPNNGNNKTLDLSGYTHGLYFIHIKTANQEFVKKFLLK